MSGKRLQVINTDTGKVETDIEFEGGYNVCFQNNRNDGGIHWIRRLNNARYGEKHWIMNYKYAPIANTLLQKFSELAHIVDEGYKILFIEDIKYKEPDTGKWQWQARIKKASTDFLGATGYQYIIETRRYYTKSMSEAQIAALIYHELMHIDVDGTLRHHDIEDWSNLVATLGKNWDAYRADIKNITDDDFDTDSWAEVMPIRKQLTLFENQEKR